jgi:hypothetical protein
MNLSEALGIVVGRTGQTAYRDRCDPDHPRHNPDYIPVVMRMAESLAASPEELPLTRKIGNALAAVGRVVGAVAQGENVLAPVGVFAERLERVMNSTKNGERLCEASGCRRRRSAAPPGYC